MTRVVVRSDIFPARIRVSSTTFSNLRVVITDTELLAYRLAPNGPDLIMQRTVTGDLDGTEVTGINVPTADGNVFVEKTGGCGCGSRLRSADLFPGMQRVMIGR